MNNKKGNKGMPFIFIVAILCMLLFLFYNPLQSGKDKTSYSDVIREFERAEVSEYSIDLGSGKVNYRLKSDDKGVSHNYTAADPYIMREDIDKAIAEYNNAHPNSPKYSPDRDYDVSANFLEILFSVLPMLMAVGFIIFIVMMNRQGGQIGNVGRARTKQGFESERTATFADVAGADEEKEELQELVEYLKNPNKFNYLGAKIPKGVLLVGPPGTGKTLLARAVAGESGVPFYSISGSDFVELYVGIGASRVRDLFEKAKKTRPSIIFIDEIDAVGRQRGAGLGGGHDEREQTLNQLLVELDGFNGNEGVIVMAATNRADILDHALLRPGRFDRQVFVGYPDIKGREQILRVHAKNKPFAPDVELKTIAKTTPGFTGADLENLLNEAALLSARRGKKAITHDEIEEASIKVIAGPEKKSRVITPQKRRIMAYHEAGHAVAYYYVSPEKPVHQVSIIPRGTMGGFTVAFSDEERYLISKNEMLDDIVTALGGRVAEKLAIGDITTGASSDLEHATSTARQMVTKYGFSDNVGSVVYNTNDEVFLGRDFTQSRNYSEKVASDIDKEVHAIIEGSMDRCTKVLTEHIDKLHAVAGALLAQDRLDDEEFLGVMEGRLVISPPQDPGAGGK
jgi:cell division protease FtsH